MNWMQICNIYNIDNYDDDDDDDDDESDDDTHDVFHPGYLKIAVTGLEHTVLTDSINNYSYDVDFDN